MYHAAANPLTRRRSVWATVLFFFLSGFSAGMASADGWNAEDETFDPNLPSVIIGNRTWIGDPVPFTLATQSNRVGYTHIHTPNWAGFPPSVAISLMVPLQPGESKPIAGASLMLEQQQAALLAEKIAGMLKQETTAAEKSTMAKKWTLQTAMKGADWKLVSATDDDQTRFIQLENKVQDQVHAYRFSSSASKKLISAVRHFQKQLNKTK